MFARLCVDSCEYDKLNSDEQRMCESVAIAAERFAGGMTGLSCAREDGADEDANADLRYAVLVLAAEMIDNRQMTAQYTSQNPTVMQILGMHSTNLLPGVE